MLFSHKNGACHTARCGFASPSPHFNSVVNQSFLLFYQKKGERELSKERKSNWIRKCACLWHGLIAFHDILHYFSFTTENGNNRSRLGKGTITFFSRLVLLSKTKAIFPFHLIDLLPFDLASLTTLRHVVVIRVLDTPSFLLYLAVNKAILWYRE